LYFEQVLLYINYTISKSVQFGNENEKLE